MVSNVNFNFIISLVSSHHYSTHQNNILEKTVIVENDIARVLHKICNSKVAEDSKSRSFTSNYLNLYPIGSLVNLFGFAQIKFTSMD